MAPSFVEKIKKTGRINKKIFFVAADVVIIGLSIYLAFLLRFEGSIPAQYNVIIDRLTFLSLIFYLPGLYWQKIYFFSWSFVSLQDLISLFKAVSTSFLFLVAALFVFREYYFFSGFPRSVIFISYFLIFLMIGGLRFAKRVYSQIFLAVAANGKERTMIIGAGDAGEQIARGIMNSKTSPYLPVVFIDDNKSKWGNLIHGIKIEGGIERIPEIATRNAVSEIIIALPSAGSKAIRRALELGRRAGIKKIKVVPSIFDLIDGTVSLDSIRKVNVEDLLERDPVTLDTEAIGELVQRKRVLITGAAGSIGSELCRQVAKFNPGQLLAVDQDETGIFNISNELGKNYPKLPVASFVADIADAGKIDSIFSHFKPELVFHAAAYKHVPLMEAAPDEAVKNNIFGTKTVAEAALNYHAEKFIMISTDKALNPSSVMGVTKRICEIICQNLNQKNSTKFISVRFGNVLNSRGSVIPIFREQIKRGGPVEVTHPEMKRYFMLTSEACLLVLQAAALGAGGEVFVLDMGHPVKILDLAREMIRLSGFEPDKDIAIKFIGLRPGEKIVEEILTAAEEGTIATANQKIFIARRPVVDGDTLKGNLDKLKLAARSQDNAVLAAILKKMVPTYVPFKKV